MKAVGIPFSREAECYVLGAMMIESRLADEFCGRLGEEHFYVEENKKVYRAILNLYENRQFVDVVSVGEELKKLHLHESVGGNDYLIKLIDSIPSIVNTEVYVDTLEKKEIERALYYAVQKISKDILDGEEGFQDLLVRAEKDINDIVSKQRTSPLKAISTATEEVMNLIEANKNKTEGDLIGINTGFEELNNYTYGFQPGELIILAARPGVGKSAFALNVASKASEIDHCHVAFFSLEMGIDQLVMRLLSSYSNVPLGKIRQGKMNENDTAKLLAGKKILDGLNLYLDESTTTNIEDIKVKCRKYKREGKLDFVVIDYLQLLTASKKGSRYEEVSYLSRALKLLARELEVPVLALSQLSRAVEKEKNGDESRKPMLSDLRESGSIEQDADIVLFLHNTGNKSDDTKFRNRKTELIIAKNRQGMTDSFYLQFRGDCSQFVSQNAIKENNKE